MLLKINSNGTVLYSIPESINQGSNLANSIQIIAPFSKTLTADIAFQLPQGTITEPVIMVPREFSSNDSYNLWTVDIDSTITQYAGNVLFSVRFYTLVDTDEDIKVLTTVRSSFPVSKSVLPALPLEPTAETYQNVLAHISDLYLSKVDRFDINDLPDSVEYTAEGFKTSNALFTNATFTIDETVYNGSLMVLVNETVDGEITTRVQTEILYADDTIFRRMITIVDEVVTVGDWKNYSTEIMDLQNSVNDIEIELTNKVDKTSTSTFGLTGEIKNENGVMDIKQYATNAPNDGYSKLIFDGQNNKAGISQHYDIPLLGMDFNNEINLNQNGVEITTDKSLTLNTKRILTEDDIIQSTVKSVNGRTGNVILTKADIGLGNVDNTSDLNKPVSTATQTELDKKVNVSSSINQVYSTLDNNNGTLRLITQDNTNISTQQFVNNIQLANGNYIEIRNWENGPDGIIKDNKIILTTDTFTHNGNEILDTSTGLTKASQTLTSEEQSQVRTNIDVYSKSEVDNKVSSVFKYKGSVATYDDLPTEDLSIGDVWNVIDTGDNYAWTGTVWDKLGGDVDLGNYLAKDNTTAFTPTGDYNPATKKYADDGLALKEPLLPTTPTDPESKFLNGNKVWTPIVIGGSSSAAAIYLTDDISTTVETYKQLSYALPSTETTVSAVVTAGTSPLLVQTYIYDADYASTIIDAGKWTFNFTALLSTTAGTTHLRVEVFTRTNDGTETTLFTVDGADINSTTAVKYVIETLQSGFVVNTTDRLGVRVYAITTQAGNTTVTYYKGDGRGAYVNTPLALRHSQLRDINGDANYQHITQTQKTKLDNLNAPLIFNNITVLTTDFADNLTYSEFPYRASITLSGVLSTDSPKVYFSMADINTAVLTETIYQVVSYSGGIHIYATDLPTSNLTIDKIEIIR